MNTVPTGALFCPQGSSQEEQGVAVRLLAAQLGGERVAEARVDVPEEAEEGAAEAEEKVQKHHQLHVSGKHLLSSCDLGLTRSDREWQE